MQDEQAALLSADQTADDDDGNRRGDVEHDAQQAAEGDLAPFAGRGFQRAECHVTFLDISLISEAVSQEVIPGLFARGHRPRRRGPKSTEGRWRRRLAPGRSGRSTLFTEV